MHRIQLSDHFTNQKLIRFTLPSILMMMFTSIYGMVDGFFVSNYVSKTAFAAVNLIMPAMQILGGLGAMLGVGGSALTAKTLGEGDRKRAGRYFTMMIWLMVITGVICMVLGIAFIRQISYLFGADDTMIEDCVTYGSICMAFNLALHAQYTFQGYLVVAERPKLGLLATVAAGVTNMILDWLFMGVFGFGVSGAALATGLSQCVGGGIPLVWFLSKRNTSNLHFVKTRFERKPMLKACANGASEMLSSVSASITGILYNRQLMFYAGSDGVAAYGVVMYAAFVFISIFVGYSSGTSPIVGYHFGAQNHKELRNVLRRSLILLGSVSLVLTAIAVGFARTISSIFVGYDADLLKLTTRAFTICSLPFLVMWLNIYASSFFTGLNDGGVSAAISFLRALVLPVACILTLPRIWQLDGVWFSLVASEVLGVLVSAGFLLGKRRKYHY